LQDTIILIGLPQHITVAYIKETGTQVFVEYVDPGKQSVITSCCIGLGCRGSGVVPQIFCFCAKIISNFEKNVDWNCNFLSFELFLVWMEWKLH